MKRILAPILLMTLLFPSIAYGETMDDLVKRDGIHYKKFSTVPFTGKVTGKSQGSFRNGKEDGPWVEYHKNGQLGSRGTYRDGKKNGYWVTYFSGGQMSSKGTWMNDRMHGKWTLFLPNGTLDYGWTGTYKNGKKISN
jgi:antitoxin component YwqK of YwqJK toxin-antitoxin module